MKKKYGYIGNSSSASYYIRRSGNHKEVDLAGEDGIYLDCWYKYNPKTEWKQSARLDVTVNPDPGLAINGFNIKHAAIVANSVRVADFSEDSFDDISSTDSNTIFAQPTTTYNVIFGAPDVTVPVTAPWVETSESNEVTVYTGVDNLISYGEGSEYVPWTVVLNGTNADSTDNTFPPPIGTYVITVQWTGNVLRIRAGHNMDSVKAVASTAIMLTDFNWTTE